MNTTRIDFLRPQMAHVLRAKISSDERMEKTRRQFPTLVIATDILGGNKASIAARKAGYRAQTNRVLAMVNLVSHTYLISWRIVRQ